PAEGPHVAEDSLRAACGGESDPALGTLPRCPLLQRAAHPRLEAHLLRVADGAPARIAEELEVVQAPLPPVTGALPLVRLGRPRGPQPSALSRRRQRELRRATPIAAAGRRRVPCELALLRALFENNSLREWVKCNEVQAVGQEERPRFQGLLERERRDSNPRPPA